MKKLVVILFLCILFSSCEKSKSQIVNDEINNIVEAIINQDSLKIDDVLFCNELKKTTIEIPVETKDGLQFPPIPGNIYISTLLNNKVKGKPFFTSKDSLFILSQNSDTKKIKIGNTILQKLNSTTFEKELMKKEKGIPYKFYEMSIPLFSKDKQKAYVQLDYRCGSLCGHGKAYYLKKVNNNWIIVEKWRNWIS